MKKSKLKILILSLAFVVSFAACFFPMGAKDANAASTKKSDYEIYAVKADKTFYYYNGKYHRPKITSVWAYDTKTGKSFKLSKDLYTIDGFSAKTRVGQSYGKKCGVYCSTIAGKGSYKGHRITGSKDLIWEIDLKPMKKSDIKVAYKGSKSDALKITAKLPPHDGGYYLCVEDETTGEIIYSYSKLKGKKRTIKKTVKIGAPNNHIYAVYISAYGSVKKISATQYQAYSSEAYKRVKHKK